MADFTNIDGVYVKDTELRSGIDTLRTTVLSNTIKPLTVTKNDTYTAIPSSGTYGYSPVTVDVQEEPWTPLQDGYSNFWFELTNDTLSPWLNFSAKNANAVIDWGDGSGEVTLDTLTPTHTYSKAGKYVVKVKGVTGIASRISNNTGKYQTVLYAVEFNNEVTSLAANAFERFAGMAYIDLGNASSYGVYTFTYCTLLTSVSVPTGTTTLPRQIFGYCISLENAVLPEGLTTIGIYAFVNCYSLKAITIPSTVTTIENSVFSNCPKLLEIHVLPTTPPTLGATVFVSLPNNYVIYVPVGYGETYKSATGWSDYADHIVEEGQSLSMAALRRIQAEKNDNGEEMR